jgi:hypothetical protein
MKNLIPAVALLLASFVSNGQTATPANPGQSYLDITTLLVICGGLAAFLFIVVYALARAVNALSEQVAGRPR